jgi:hypothetical protein
MSVPRIDPRVNLDRIYQYGEYQVLSATFRRRKASTWSRLLGLKAQARPGTTPRLRLMPFRLTMICGLLVLTAGLVAQAYFTADSVRLAYAKQELTAANAGLDQSINEAVSDNASAQNAVLRGKKVNASEVAYPAQTQYLVLTNIPDPSRARLVNQLYPLSKRIIRVQP